MPSINQWGACLNFKITENYLENLGFKRMEDEQGIIMAYPSRFGAIVVTLLEGTRIHIRRMCRGKTIPVGKFNGNCKNETEFLDRLEFLTLL